MSGPEHADARPWPAFWVCAGVASITILDLTKVNVALPSIEQGLEAGPTELQLVVSGYVLALALLMVPMGRLGDQRSRRALLVAGLSLFTVASALCGLAPNAEVLLAGRLLQGVAAGIHMPQVMGLIQQLFRGAAQGRAFGMFGATIGLATAFGPLVGGLFVAAGGEQDGWRGIFWMNVPLCLAAIVFALRLLPRSDGGARRLDLDPVGIVLFGGVVVALMLPFLLTTGSPQDPSERWWALAAFAALLGLLILWERRYAARGRTPLLPANLFRAPAFRNGAIVGAAYFSGMPAMFLVTTLFLQTGVRMTALSAAVVTVGFALSSAVTSWAGGRLVARHGRRLVALGLAVMLLAVAALIVTALLAPAAHVGWIMAAVMVIGGLGAGFVIAPNQALMYEEVPRSQAGVAGSVGQLGQRVGTAIGTAVALSLFYATVYRENGHAAAIVVYHDAYAAGMLAVAGFLAVALVTAIADLARRRGIGSAGAA
ncbi:MFS transporter [Microbacterium lacusdiani]